MKLGWQAAMLSLGVCIGTQASAQTCPSGTTTPVPRTRAVLTNVTVCATRGTDRWQEFHAATGALIDYKRGPSHPVDPTTTVGTWTATPGATGGTVTYNYTGGSSYTYAVCKDNVGSSYTFVSATAGTIGNVSLLNGQVPCP